MIPFTVMALYKDVHPEYASYLYLMAPISLAILNPIGLILMEIAKIAKNKTEQVSGYNKFETFKKYYRVYIVHFLSRYKILLYVLKRVLLNKWPNVIVA